MEVSNISLQRPNISPVTIDEDGLYTVKRGSYVPTNFNDLAGKYNIVILLSFSALDALLDYWHPSLTSDSFRKRFKALPSNTPIEKVVSNAYRIIMALRNGLVHEKNGIGASASGVHLDVGIKFKTFISCSAVGVGALVTIIYLLLKTPDMTDKYSESYLVALHNRLITELGNKYVDGIDNHLKPIEDSLGFALGERMQFEYSLSSELEVGNIDVNRYPMVLTAAEPNYRDQFLFRWGGKISLVPGEVLDIAGTFKPNHLIDWLIKPGHTLARH